MDCPVALDPVTIPFLYESFETALVDSFPEVFKIVLIDQPVFVAWRDDVERGGGRGHLTLQQRTEKKKTHLNG